MRIFDFPDRHCVNAGVLHDGRADTQDIYAEGAGHMTLTVFAYELPPLCLLFGQDMLFDADKYEADINAAYVDFLDEYLKGGKQE